MTIWTKWANKLKKWVQQQSQSSHSWKPSSHPKQCQLYMSKPRSQSCSRQHTARLASYLYQDRPTPALPNVLLTPKVRRKRSPKVRQESSLKTRSRPLNWNSRKRSRCLSSYQVEAINQNQRSNKAELLKPCLGPLLPGHPPTKRTRSSAWKLWIVRKKQSWCATQWSRSKLWLCSRDQCQKIAAIHGLWWVHRAQEVPSLSLAATIDHHFPTQNWRRLMSWWERHSIDRGTCRLRRLRESQVCSITRAYKRSCIKHEKVAWSSARFRFVREMQSDIVLLEALFVVQNINFKDKQ